MASDRLLNELERQQKYLAKLPSDYGFPLFNAKQALYSQRRRGYRNSAAASREIVDNAIEAGASRVHVVFDAGRIENGPRLVEQIALIDNGSGMLPQMARYALSWGGGTPFEDPGFTGDGCAQVRVPEGSHAQSAQPAPSSTSMICLVGPTLTC